MNIAWLLVLGAIIPLLDSTMVNIAIKHLSNDFSIGLDLIQGVISLIILMILKLSNFTPANIKAKFDFIGIILLGSSSAALIYGITKAAKSATLNNSTSIAYAVAGGFRKVSVC